MVLPIGELGMLQYQPARQAMPTDATETWLLWRWPTSLWLDTRPAPQEEIHTRYRKLDPNSSSWVIGHGSGITDALLNKCLLVKLPYNTKGHPCVRRTCREGEMTLWEDNKNWSDYNVWSFQRTNNNKNISLNEVYEIKIKNHPASIFASPLTFYLSPHVPITMLLPRKTWLRFSFKTAVWD